MHIVFASLSGLHPNRRGTGYAGAPPIAIAGLFQVNVLVPLTVDSSDDVPVITRIGNEYSQNNVTVIIRAK